MTRKTKVDTNGAQPDSIPYRQLRQQLDDVLAKLQDPDCDVDDAVALYEQALQLAKQLESQLQSAENSVNRLQAKFSSDKED